MKWWREPWVAPSLRHQNPPLSRDCWWDGPRQKGWTAGSAATSSGVYYTIIDNQRYITHTNEGSRGSVPTSA